MLIYRVEHSKTGKGPYTDTFHSKRFNVLLYSTNTHPEPQEDGIKFYPGWLVGCQSMELLSYWFSKAWRVLEEEGFIVAVYRAINPAMVHLGGKQCAFTRGNAELLHTQSIHTILSSAQSYM